MIIVDTEKNKKCYKKWNVILEHIFVHMNGSALKGQFLQVERLDQRIFSLF